MKPRFAVVCGRFGQLSPTAAGTAIGRGAAQHSEVAFVPVAVGGHDLAEALGVIWNTEPEGDPDRWRLGLGGRLLVGLQQRPAAPWAPEAATTDLGEWVRASLRPDTREVVVDLTTVTAHDGGAGLLAALGRAMDGRRLIGLVGEDELRLPATGIGSGLALRAFEGQVDLAELLAADAKMSEHARALGPGLETAPGGGAAGGCGLAVLALGGELTSATQFCHYEARLGKTMHAADAILTGCAELSALDRGGPVITAIARWAGEAQRPCLLVTSGAGLSRRELRELGIEAAYLLPTARPNEADLTEMAARAAAGWGMSSSRLA